MKKNSLLLLSAFIVLFQNEAFCQQTKVHSEGLQSLVFNYKTFSPKNDIKHDVWMKFNPDFPNHPEEGKVYSYTPNKSCIEIINKRTEHEKYYVDPDQPSHIYKQDGFEPLHFKSGDEWITIDQHISPIAFGVYEASNQIEPTGFDINKRNTYIKTHSNAKVSFNNWRLYGEKAGVLTLLAEPNWNTYTAGDDGIYITDMFPGIDAEMRVSKGAIKTNFIIKKALFSSFDKLIFKDRFESSAAIQMEFRHNATMMMQKGDAYISLAGKSIVDIRKAYAYAKKDPTTASDLLYKMEGNELSVLIDNSFIEKYIKDGPVVVDPLVTGSTSLAGSSMGSKYNATCTYTNSCDYSMNVTTPTGATFTDVKWYFAYLASSPCGMGNGVFNVRSGACVPGVIWGCGGGPGACGGTISDFGLFSPCLPAPSCSSSSTLTFTLKIWRGCVGVDTGCTTTCISGYNNWVVTIEGRTVEYANKIVISTPKDSICANTTVIFSKVTQNGIPPYSATNWSTSRTGTPSIGTGDSVTRTFPASGIYWIYARTTDACGNLALDSQRVFVTMPLTVVDTSSPVICVGQSVNITASAATKGNALDFGGTTGNYVSIPNSTGNSLAGLSNFTVSAWVYPRSNSHQQILFHGLGCSSWHNWTLSLGGFEYAYEYWPKKLGFSFLTVDGGGLNYIGAADTVVPNTWVHVAVTYDGSNLRLYLNGVLNNTVAASGVPWNSSENLYIGLDPGCVTGGRLPYNGKIDEVQIWNKTRSATEIFTAYRGLALPSSSNLTAYYRFDENNGRNVYDLSANANYGLIVNSVSREIPSSAPLDNNIGGTVSYAWSPATGLSTTTGASVTASPSTSTIYTITTTNSATTCTNTSMVRVQVNPLPTISGTLSACVGNTSTLTGSATAHATTPWTSSNTAVATITSAGVVTGISAGTTTITYRNSNNCTITATFTVNPLPTISGTLNACVGSTSTLTGSATPDATTPWTSSNTAVATITSAGVVTGISAGTTTISYKNTNGCIQTATFTVNALPTISGTLSACVGQTSTLTGSATADATTPWTSSNTAVATVSSSGVVTGVSAGTATITYKNSNGCIKTATFTVNALPTISGTLSACVGNTSTLTGSATADATTPWTSSNTSVATITSAGVVTGVSAGTSTITYKNSNGCTITASFTVNALPTISGTLSACVGQTSTLTGSATPDATTPWTSSNTAVASVSSTGVVTGVSAGTTTITYKNSNGCIKTASFTVNALPTISGTLNTCVGSTSTLIGSATPDATTPWTTSNTAVATISSTGVVTGVSAGSATITYKNNNGCTITTSFTVNALPTISGTLSACVGQTSSLTGSATPDATTPWTSSNTAVATVSSSGVVTGVSAGTATISYKNSNGCIITATFTTNPLPLAPVVTSPLNLCIGSAALALTATGINLKWYNVATGGSPIGTPTPSTASLGSTNYYVSQTTALGCEGPRATLVVTVQPLPTVSISSLSTSGFFYCHGKSVNLKANSATATGYQWQFASIPVAGSTFDTVFAGKRGYWSVIVNDIYGCKAKDSVFIKEDTSIIPTLSPTEVSICQEGGALLTCNPGYLSYKFNWYKDGLPLAGVPTISNLATANLAGLYRVVVTNALGCNDSTNITTVSYYPKPTKPTVVVSSPWLESSGTYLFYQWYRNGLSISGANAKKYKVTSKGLYHVEVTDQNGCLNNSDTVNISPTSINAANISSSAIKLYPNPTRNLVNIESPIKVNIRVTDMIGKLILEAKDATKIDLEPYADGLYLLTITDSDGNYIGTEKIKKMSE